VFHKGLLVGAELTWQRLFRVEKGDLLFSNIKAWEGAFAVVGENDHGRVGSHRYLTCAPVPDVAESWFLWFYLQTPEGLLQIQEASPGSADRNRTLSTKRLMAIDVPVPPIEKQRAFVRLLGRANEARQALASASSDRDQLLPVLLRQMFANAAKALPGTERSAA
jgi:type I restriction enzyme S subunit